MKPLHVLITCRSAYKDFLPYCLNSLERFVKNPILSRHIITDCPDQILADGYKVISDQDFWEVIDPAFRYPSLFEEKWVMQQIFKFNCDRLVKGDVLIVDADLLFVKDMQFFSDDCYNLYLSQEYDPEYFASLEKLLGIPKQTQEMQSFITDFAVFNTEILANLKHDIQQQTGMYWLDAIVDMLECPDHNLSEFEIYGNYLLARHPERVQGLIEPVDYIMRLEIDWRSFTPNGLIAEIISRSDNYYQCVEVDRSSRPL